MSEDQENKEASLKKEVGLFSGVGLIVGTIIGSGIFVTPGGVLANSGCVYVSLIVWVSCGILSCLGAFSFAELGAMIPESGAEYPYILRGLGRPWAFLLTWMSVFVLRPSSAAIISQTFALYTVKVFSDPDGDAEQLHTLQTIVAIGAVGVICLINCLSVRLTLMVQNTFAFSKVLALIIIICGGIYQLINGHTEYLEDGFEPVPNTELSVGSLALAFYSGLYSFEGWKQLNFVTEELKQPARDLPRAIIIGMTVVTCLYLSANVSYLTSIEPSSLAQPETTVATAFAYALFPKDSLLYTLSPYIMTSFVAMSTFGSANGSLFASSRLCFVSSRNGDLPQCLSYVYNRTSTPIPSLIFIAFLAILMILAGGIQDLIAFSGFVAWLFYGLAFLSLIVMRFTEPQLERPFKVWLVVPFMAILLSCFLLFAPIVDDLLNDRPLIQYVYISGFLLVGFAMYLIFIKFGFSIPGFEKANEFVRVTFNLSYGHKDEQLI